MKIKIALAGNPNCGKTTLFNELTGSRQHVGNWPGVTVDKKEGIYKKDKEVSILDLPGIYSLSPYSAEEIVARDYIVKEKPDIVVNIVDGTSIERNLYLTLQIMETGIPMVIAVNMMDEVESRGDKIDCNQLSSLLGVPVLPMVARSGKGMKEVMDMAISLTGTQKKSSIGNIYSPAIKKAISEIEGLLSDKNEEDRKWKAIKLVEGDEIVQSNISGSEKSKIDAIIADVAKEEGDVEAKIADLRYKHIAVMVRKAVKKKSGHLETVSDKIDRVLTNRVFALPIFALIMYLIFSITFGETVLKFIPGPGVWLQTVVTDFWDGPLSEFIISGLENLGAAQWTVSLVGDGVLAGLGGVISFLPQILVLFLLLSFLEDSGYMARVAFVMDRVFRKFGLTGKSFIPLLMGFGCSVPAIMASRTLDSDKDRKLTMMITPFMSCGAKLPIYMMFAVTLFRDINSVWLVLGIYFLGLGVAIISGIILSKTIFKGANSNFIMELPQYRIPTLKSVLIHGWEKLKGFVIRAGTVIFASTVLIWLLSRFTFGFQYLPEVEMGRSILATLGKAVKWIFIPLGFGNDWRPVVGTITGFIAKENIVATFGVLFHAAEGAADLAMAGEAAIPGVADVFSRVSSVSYMAFNLLCMPCFAAVGALKKEMGTWKWTFKAVLFQMLTAYVVALLIFQIGNLIF